MIGKLKDLTMNRDGTQNITLTVNADFREEFDELANGEIKVEIKKYNPARSLDANAKNISINFSHGGKFYISVEDDGIGMSEDEILLAIERHATSKISKIDDLGSLSSFGFRGEAIPSISSVAQMTISSKNDRDDFGTKVRLSGGNVLSIQKIARQTGTKIVVENLFFNVPARRNFLKSTQAEMRHIVEEFTRVSLMNPEIDLRLIAMAKRYTIFIQVI
jgi:DNA mismatch repair protein MutL